MVNSKELMQNSKDSERHLESKAKRAWNDLMKASKQISKKWKEPTALEEIQSQREKEW